MFADLLAQPGVVETLELRSRFGFLAFHGGSLEQVTDTIATEAAERSGASLYVVAQPPELRWHIPSRLVTADASPKLARLPRPRRGRGRRCTATAGRDAGPTSSSAAATASSAAVVADAVERRPPRLHRRPATCTTSRPSCEACTPTTR